MSSEAREGKKCYHLANVQTYNGRAMFVMTTVSPYTTKEEVQSYYEWGNVEQGSVEHSNKIAHCFVFIHEWTMGECGLYAKGDISLETAVPAWKFLGYKEPNVNKNPSSIGPCVRIF